MATIDDVAARAGVSTKTVSRVLNNEPHVRPAMREKVEAAARALDYRPNQAARRLAGGRSFLIALLYDTPSSNYSGYISAIQAGAARRCRELGYHLVVEPVDNRGHDMLAVIHRLVETLAPDGVILAPPLSDDAAVIGEFQRLGTPIVNIAAIAAGSTRIFMDERCAGRAVTRYLLSIGHRRIGIVRGHPEHKAAGARFDGYADALKDAGIRVDAQLITQGFFDLQSGIEAGRSLLGRPNRPTAIFATNDEMAVGVIMAARELDLDVPHDVSVAGFDDTPMSRLIWPPLTTVRQPLKEMGAESVTMLVERRSGLELLLPYELIVRDSTAPLDPVPQSPARARSRKP